MPSDHHRHQLRIGWHFVQRQIPTNLFNDGATNFSVMIRRGIPQLQSKIDGALKRPYQAWNNIFFFQKKAPISLWTNCLLINSYLYRHRIRGRHFVNRLSCLHIPTFYIWAGRGGKRNVPLLVNKIVSKYLFRRRATLISLFVKESNHFIMLHKSSSSSSVSAFVQKPDLLLEHWEHFAGHVSCSKRLAANMFRSSCREELITKGNQWWIVYCPKIPAFRSNDVKNELQSGLSSCWIPCARIVRISTGIGADCCRNSSDSTHLIHFISRAVIRKH